MVALYFLKFRGIEVYPRPLKAASRSFDPVLYFWNAGLK